MNASASADKPGTSGAAVTSDVVDPVDLPNSVEVVDSVEVERESLRAGAKSSVNAVLRSARAPRTLRTRLTVVVSLIATIAIIAVLAIATYGLPRLLQNTLDNEQKVRVDRIEASLTKNGSLPASETFAQVVSPLPLDAGYVIISESQPFRGTLLNDEQLSLAVSKQNNVTVNLALEGLDGNGRLFARAATINGRSVVIVVGSSLAQLERTRRFLLTLMVVGGALLSLLTTAGAWLVAGAALRPVQRMTDEAAELAKVAETAGVEGLHRRLVIPRTRDEVAYLGETFNDLLERVEESVQRERMFVDDASHELRTPLAILRGELELAATHPGDMNEQHELVARLAKEVDRLANLANDLLVLARARGNDAPNYVSVDLLSLATRVVGRLGSTTTRVRIEVDGEPLSLPWRTDHAERILNNLITNAIRHAKNHVVVSVHRDNASAVLAVQDDGQGFPPDFVPRAFERFATADRARNRRQSGTGLGLAIVRELTEARGGVAEALLPSGGGGLVRVTIPL